MHNIKNINLLQTLNIITLPERLNNEEYALLSLYRLQRMNMINDTPLGGMATCTRDIKIKEAKTLIG